MRIKPVTDYALRMLTYLAVKNDVANSKEISEQLNIPQKNVLSIGRDLKKAKYINILSGPYGGYMIVKKPEDIVIYHFFRIFEDIKINCYSKKGTQSIVDAAITDLYSCLQGMVEEKMKSETLADLLRGNTADSI